MAAASPAASPTHYAYRASLVGAAHRFELTDEGLAWHVHGRSGLWSYDRIAAIRLSYRPVSMQARRFRADIVNADGGRLTLFSTDWRTAALMAPQDEAYRAFILELHRRLASSSGHQVLEGGLGPRLYATAAGLLALVGLAIAALLLRAVIIGAWAGALFLVGFAALMIWQVGGFVRRNRTQRYTADRVPAELLP